MKDALAVFAALVILMLTPMIVMAHCDTMNGPVVTAAKNALEADNVHLVLIWVPSKDEAEIKAAFEKTMAVRKLSPAAKELADLYFFETVVRVHRAGEGVPYTGLKPAGTEIEPGIAEADRAIESNSVDHLVESLSHAVQENVRHRFDELTAHRNYAVKDLTAGREYVKAYVEFIHFVERLHADLTTSPDIHSERPAKEHAH